MKKKIEMHDLAARDRQVAKQRKQHQRSLGRLERLERPITLKQVTDFTERLISVSFGAGDECWLFVGSSKGTTVNLNINTKRYGSMKHNGEVIGPHVFSFAASRGIPVSELTSPIKYDVHHLPRYGKCIGYRCCNPVHLEKREHNDHARKGKEESKAYGLRVKDRHERMIETVVLDVAPRQRRPADLELVTGAGLQQRFFAGLPFLIRWSGPLVLPSIENSVGGA